MLSAQAAATVRATLTAIGGSIGEITPLFYRRLFAAHPELARDLFNRGNQADGSQQQALAGSIVAFATVLLERPEERPDAMLARIAHKHASLGVRPEQYPVVREHLFAAIVEVLGEAVTPEVAAAWDEVYWLMANALIAIEARLCQEAGVPVGEVWREYRVVGRRAETAEVVTFEVEPADGGPAPAHRPGQYVSVQVELADGARQIRQYSLSGASADTLRFTVKRDGEVSRHLYERVPVGAAVRVSLPFGDVHLDGADDAPVLLVSAGIGCTPMIGILSHLVEGDSKRRVIAAHADRSPADHAFRAELGRLTAALPNGEAHVWYERPESAEWPADRTGLIDLSALVVPPGTTAYLCGPLPFLRFTRSQLIDAGLPASAIHYEVFGPDLWLARA
ncbi:globin domain-containing protein [Kitasatospora viridis]|uniref:nitric oxide dioxygenase n=1 Tax=Kitasatospora viridis TaxID=281105 RepID=A0A561UPH6_9ACTN|nr:globin domain-containing protein [Kitasatospora viridis]TWG01278.1 nitric oxide dioxygenase [Kitasatospora viridis]